MAGARYFYGTGSSDYIGEQAAKVASSSDYTTPLSNTVINSYFSDTSANYSYITPREDAGNTYGLWGNYDYYKIAANKFYTKTNNVETVLKFVDRRSAPLLSKATRDTNWGRCQAPFSYYAFAHNFAGYTAKLYWDSTNNRIQVNVYSDDNYSSLNTSFTINAYGVFIMIAGGGGGGGGGDAQY
jgi:hypothetical protein